MTLGALVATVGTFLFGIAPGYLTAGIGRLLIGASVAVAWVCMLKLAGHWFSPNRYAAISGVALFCGLIGGVFAGVPLRLLIASFGWRIAMLLSAAAPLAAAVGIWKMVRDDPSERGYSSFFPEAEGRRDGEPAAAIRSGIREVFRNRNIWLLLFVPGGIVGSVLSFSGLWGVPYLTARFGMSDARAAALTSLFLVSWGLGGPFFGWISDRIGRRKPLFLAGAFAACVGWAAIVYLKTDSQKAVMLLLLFTGFMSGCMILGFASAKESLPIRLAGTVSGVVNAGVMMGPVVLQPVIGWILIFSGREPSKTAFALTGSHPIKGLFP